MKHVPIPDHWTPEQALTLAAFLERVIEAIWRAHGPEMAQELLAPQPRRRHPRPRQLRPRPLRPQPLRRIVDDDIPF